MTAGPREGGTQAAERKGHWIPPFAGVSEGG